MKLRRIVNATGLTRGFTIIELLVVMAVLGVLAAAVMPLGETISPADCRSSRQRVPPIKTPSWLACVASLLRANCMRSTSCA